MLSVWYQFLCLFCHVRYMLSGTFYPKYSLLALFIVQISTFALSTSGPRTEAYLPSFRGASYLVIIRCRFVMLSILSTVCWLLHTVKYGC